MLSAVISAKRQVTRLWANRGEGRLGCVGSYIHFFVLNESSN